MRNVALTVSSVSRARPPMPAPTAIAAGRLRPVLIVRVGGLCVVLTGLSFGTRGPSDLEQLGFLVLEQIVDLGDVAVGQLLQLALGAPDVILADIAVLHHLVEGVLGVPPDVTDADPRVLGLGARGLDVLAAALLG